MAFNKTELDLIQDKLAALARLSSVDLQEIMSQESDKIVDDMKAKAPVDTGRLKTNIRVTKRQHKVIFTSEAIDPETNFDYAPIQEHRHRPYFYRTARKGFRELYNRINERIKQIVIGRKN